MSRQPKDGDDTIPDILKTTVNEGLDANPIHTPRVHYLVVMRGEEAGKRMEIRENFSILGRHPGNELVVKDQRISGQHCRLELVNDRLYVHDLQSTNGTYVDGEPVQGAPRILPAESIMQAGGTLLRHEWRPRDEVEASEYMAEELRRAVSYVEDLLPEDWASGPVQANWTFVPSATLGGDALGYFHIDDDHVACFLLDVCGHGPAAAMHSVSAMSEFSPDRRRQTDFRQPALVLRELNDRFPMQGHGGMYFSIWYGVISLRDATLTFASAGHPPALLFRAEDQKLEPLRTPQPAIGVANNLGFEQARVTGIQNARLVLYSDGAFEFVRANQKRSTMEDFLPVVAATCKAGESSSELVERLKEQAENRVFDDDVSVLILDLFPSA